MVKWNTRADWDARPAERIMDVNPTRGCVVHWVGGGEQENDEHEDCLRAVNDIQRYHLTHPNEPYVDIAYNLICCVHGYVIEGRSTQRRPQVRGGATGNMNGSTLAVLALWGSGDRRPPESLLQTLGEAVGWLREHASAGDQVTGHRDHMSTSCPGDQLYGALNLIAAYAAGAPPVPKPPPTTPDPKPGKVPPDYMGPWPYPAHHYFGPPPASGYQDPSRVHNGKTDKQAYDLLQRARRTLRWRGWTLVAKSGYYNGPPPPQDPCGYGFSEEICKFQREVMGSTNPDGYLGPKTWQAIRTTPVT